METKFQTSFIPKKPLASMAPSETVRSGGSGAGPSIFFTISIFLFVLSIVAAGASFGWTKFLLNQQSKYSQILESQEKQFNIDLIRTLKQTNVKIDLAQNLIQGHVAASQIFGIISQMTSADTRFTSMELSAPTKENNAMSLSLTGYARDFAALAFQSDVLDRLEQYGLRKIIINPVISNPAQNQDRTVSFTLSATVDPKSISYLRSISGSVQGSTQ